MSSGVAATIFLLGLLASIMLHELGHFWTARRFGMRADRYFLGFGPTLWSRRIGEAEYGVKAIPAGGFVRILGMSPEDRRLGPISEEVFDVEALAADRRAAAEQARVDVLVVPALPEPTWRRLSNALASRGVPTAMRSRVVERVRRNLPADATARDAEATLAEVLATETTDTGHVGDLQWRLLRGDEGRFFGDRPAWQRAIVLSAGSGMHFLIAIVLLFAGFLAFPQLIDEPTSVIAKFTEESAAADAGLEIGDRIVSIDGVASDDFEVLRNVIRSRAELPTQVVVDRDGEELTFTVTPTRDIDPDTGEERGLLGFYPSPVEVQLTADEALYETFAGEASFPALLGHSATALVKVFGPEGIGALVRQIGGQEERSVDGGVSIAGAPRVAGQGVEIAGPFFLIGMLASINVFVGVFNLLPLPPLDGGHLAVLGIERIVNVGRRVRGRAQDFKVDPRAVTAVALPVIVLIGTVSLALIWLDITNPITLQ